MGHVKYDIFVLVLDSKKRKIFAAETPLVKKKNKLIIGQERISTFKKGVPLDQIKKDNLEKENYRID